MTNLSKTHVWDGYPQKEVYCGLIIAEYTVLFRTTPLIIVSISEPCTDCLKIVKEKLKDNGKEKEEFKRI